MPIQKYTIQAAPGTDLWSKPSQPPVIATNPATRSYSVPIEEFRYVQVTVSAEWTRLYDQGGIILSFGDSSPGRWIKSGVEFYNEIVNVSTVATPEWSDWSLLPLPNVTKNAPVTIRLEREIKEGRLAPSLWVYYIDSSGNKLAIREVTWAFAPPHTELTVALYVARPTSAAEDSSAPESLSVTFEGLEGVPSPEGIIAE